MLDNEVITSESIDPVEARRALVERQMDAIPEHVRARRAAKCAPRASAKMLAAHQGRHARGNVQRTDHSGT